MSRVAEIIQQWPELTLARTPRELLYKRLALALELAELTVGDSEENEAFRAAIAARPALGNRTYIEAGSDIYVRVCRFLFEEDFHHNNSRYACGLREAAKRGVAACGLFRYLVESGGINGLVGYNRGTRPKVCPHCGAPL